jgi:hypothetical protein
MQNMESHDYGDTINASIKELKKSTEEALRQATSIREAKEGEVFQNIRATDRWSNGYF